MSDKVVFIAQLFNLRIEEPLQRGDEVIDGIRLSNDLDFLRGELLNHQVRQFIGELEYKSLLNANLYAYCINTNLDGALDDSSQQNYLVSCLRKLDAFFFFCWLHRDNCVNTELGFLQVFKNGRLSVSSNFFGEINSNSHGDTRSEISLLREELRQVRAKFRGMAEFPDEDIDIYGDQFANHPYGKEWGLLGRAAYFAEAARETTYLPLKIASYCTCLEAFFVRDNQEMSHKMPERVACFLEKESSSRLNLYDLLKSAYSVRSKAVHGAVVKPNPVMLRNLSVSVDDVVRRVFVAVTSSREIYDRFDKSTHEDFNRYMNSIVFGNESHD